VGEDFYNLETFTGYEIRMLIFRREETPSRT
jgi:hypothetical protein